MSVETGVETRLLSSLVKVFPDEELRAEARDSGSVLQNETFHFQWAWKGLRGPEAGMGARFQGCRITVETAWAGAVSVRKVVPIASDMPCYADHDEDVLRTAPGLYPDLLEPVLADGLTVLPGQWRSAWVTVRPDGLLPPGTWPLVLTFEAGDGSVLARETFTLEVAAAVLPPQTIRHTEWFHADCLATWYGDEPLSEAHWFRIGQFIRFAADHGINMILTPLFTLALDTQVGGERPTVQLVEVEKTGETWRFGFDRLARWMDLCFASGIGTIEFSHLFSQWGAQFAPKVVGRENGVEKRFFGWDTPGAGPGYAAFLGQFLPALTAFVDRRGDRDRVVFHISDEPVWETHRESFARAAALVRGPLEGFVVLDALSDLAFYQEGLVPRPVPANNHIQPFLDAGVRDLWTYYCCVQDKKVSNRFFNMPSARNRILGWQLYRYDLAGFLHWGFNFYYSQYSRYAVDPFRTSDAGMAFPSGDAYLVYPGPDGPLSSIRLDVLQEAFQDLRALRLLESLWGRPRVLAWVEEGLGGPLTFAEYPRDGRWILEKREELNRLVSRPTAK